MVDDIELLGHYIAEKSEAAFAELVERHIDFVYATARRRLGGDAHGAADVTQQVFARLARQASALSRGVVLPAWLYTATRNVAVDLVRAEQRRRIYERKAQMHEELNLNAAASAEWERLRPVLDGVIDELADRDRQAVLLRFFARRPFAEIGRTLRISEDAARMRVDRALEKLRTLLARRGVTSTTAALALLMTNEAAASAPAGLAASVMGSALAAGSSTPVAVWIAFMNTTKFAGTAAVAMLALAVGVGVQQEVAYRRAQSVLAVETRDTEALNDHLHLERESARSAERDRADLERVVAHARTARAEAQRVANRTVLGAPPGQPPTSASAPGASAATPAARSNNVSTRPLSRRTAAERVLFYRRTLAAWEFLLAMDEREALAQLAAFTEWEKTPLP